MVILSDLSDVLIEGIGEAGKIIAERFGEETGKKCWKRLHESRGDFKEVLCGRISEAEFCRRFASVGEWPFDAKVIQEAFSRSFRRKIPGTLEAYKSIIAYPHSFSNLSHPFFGPVSVCGCPKIYIVSDHIKERVAEIKKDHPDIFELTAGQFWSYELGKIKQSKNFFPKLLSRLDLTAQDVIFIDDNELNIEAAAKSGIIGIQFKNAIQLKADLESYGFKFA